MRQYQLLETDTLSDELLYEIGSFSPIGVVSQTDLKTTYKPSTKYYEQIIKENSLSVFSNWKALALNDSFTVLTIDDFFEINEFQENFELLYMRCLLGEFFCFDRNNLYREVDNIDNEKIEKEIKFMEQHYFFDDMSYDFLPPLMYRAMAKGVGLQTDCEQLTQHVMQSLREARREQNNTAANFVQIFAVFSVFWTIHQIIIAVCSPIDKNVESAIALLAGIISSVCTIILLKWPHKAAIALLLGILVFITISLNWPFFLWNCFTTNIISL